jgi:ABC-type branched-subunit amino acid transport system ATPase component
LTAGEAIHRAAAVRTPFELLGVTKRYGGLKAVDAVTIAFRESGIVAIIGPNGAGKTTLFNIMSGFTRPDLGECLIGGRETTRMRPDAIARRGVARSFQSVRLVQQLSVLDNLCLARPRQTGERFLAGIAGRFRPLEEADNRDFAARLAKQLDLDGVAHCAAGKLSYGQQKLLSLGCCLAMEPAILLLDEPLAGVHPALASRIMDLIKEIGGSGRLIIFIEHDLEAVSKLADEVVFLHRGAVIARGSPADVLTTPEVMEAYLD